MKLWKNPGLTAPLMLVCALVLAANSHSGAGTVLDRFTPAEREKLLAGEEVYEPALKLESAGGGEPVFSAAAMIMIDAPVEQCFQMFCDFDKQSLYMPAISLSKVQNRSGNRVVIYKELDYVVAVFKYTHILTIDPEKHRVDFVTDPTGANDVKFSRGFFQFEKVDDRRTLFTYGLIKIDPGIKIPAFIQKYMTARDLPKMAVNLKKWIESGGKWRK